MDRDEAQRLLDSLCAAMDAEDCGWPKDQPLQVPARVAARWQSAIAKEAERRALGLPLEATDKDDLSAP